LARLRDFRPTKTKGEKGDIETTVVDEFRRFLASAVDSNGAGQTTVLEIK
jgi:hypothetical protein